MIKQNLKTEKRRKKIKRILTVNIHDFILDLHRFDSVTFSVHYHVTDDITDLFLCGVTTIHEFLFKQNWHRFLVLPGSGHFQPEVEHHILLNCFNFTSKKRCNKMNEILKLFLIDNVCLLLLQYEFTSISKLFWPQLPHKNIFQ